MKRTKNSQTSRSSLLRWYAVVAERASHRCEDCHAPESFFNSRFEVEHILPMVRKYLDVLKLQGYNGNIRVVPKSLRHWEKG